MQVKYLKSKALFSCCSCHFFTANDRSTGCIIITLKFKKLVFSRIWKFLYDVNIYIEGET